MKNFLLRARGTGFWYPLSRWREGVDVYFSLETFMNMAHSHKDQFVGMNILFIITCQSDISELGFDDCCSWHRSSVQNKASYGETWHTPFPIKNWPYIIDSIVHTCSTFMMVNAHDCEQNIYVEEVSENKIPITYNILFSDTSSTSVIK